jgi:hypothetical protein
MKTEKNLFDWKAIYEDEFIQGQWESYAQMHLAEALHRLALASTAEDHIVDLKLRKGDGKEITFEDVDHWLFRAAQNCKLQAMVVRAGRG